MTGYSMPHSTMGGKYQYATDTDEDYLQDDYNSEYDYDQQDDDYMSEDDTNGCHKALEWLLSELQTRKVAGETKGERQKREERNLRITERSDWAIQKQEEYDELANALIHGEARRKSLAHLSLEIFKKLQSELDYYAVHDPDRVDDGLYTLRLLFEQITELFGDDIDEVVSELKSAIQGIEHLMGSAKSAYSQLKRRRAKLDDGDEDRESGSTSEGDAKGIELRVIRKATGAKRR
ncbi:hypothetical protein FPQ18DRAFT_351501 [Pyronema domesticum]|uniref:Uncharacterized protein n=1 Tax=Pyronema omphalodes (strain CBS 100304) TaxID=1076935 RepID=U4LS33_PYROM|nr:hypothetical protein FPQ18DRAFT_351501 [Pyronema domesticum]CCX34765.1 Protein of unknown function [Pyronema omphalodes CBS 100304]